MLRGMIAVAMVVILFSSPGMTQAATTSITASVTVLPGPFTSDLVVEDEYLVLIVADWTGSKNGWSVQVDCGNAPAIPVGEVEVVVGQAVDPQNGPAWSGSALEARSGYGSGHYRQRFELCSEVLLTSVSGP